VYGFTLVGFMPLAAAWVWAFAGYAVVAACGWGVAMLRVGESRAAHVAPSRQPVQWSRPLRRMLVIVFLSAFASALIEPLYLLFLKNKFDLHIYVLALAFLPAGLVFAVLPRYSGQWSLAGAVSIALTFWPVLWGVAASYVLFAAGWAMASPAEEALVADLAPAAARGRIMGAKEAASGVGAALGPLLGGYVYDAWAPTAAFTLNGLLLLLTALLALGWFGASSQEGRISG